MDDRAQIIDEPLPGDEAGAELDNPNDGNEVLAGVETAQVEAARESAGLEASKNHDDDGNRFYLILSAIVCVVGVIIIVVMLVAVKDDDDDGVDSPASPTPAPTAPIVMVEDAQDRLDMLLEGSASNPATASFAATKIPADASVLEGINLDDETIDPVTRAAAWSVHVDPYKAEREVVQRFALAAVYYGTGGYDWLSKDGWFGESSFCDGWEGLRCCGDYHVEVDPHQCLDKEKYHLIEVDLAENNLKGVIPLAFALLEYVEILWLEGNDLTGPLDPVIFSNMPHLDSLYVHRNRLSGSINATLRDNGHLDTLFAHNNDFTGDWPSNFCFQCAANGDCDHDPVVYTLDCDQLDCPTLCCTNLETRHHCYNEIDDEDGDRFL